MSFNWKDQLTLAVEIKQRRGRTQAKLGHSDMKLQHKDWVRDAQAQNPNYTVMNKFIKDETEKKQQRQETFTRKLHQDG